MTPRCLDLFCGGGGAGMGLHRAGFDVTGVDIAPQPRYPLHFIQADALTFPLDGYDFVWASPMCQINSVAARRWINSGHRTYPEQVGPIRERLEAWGGPYIIENVVGAPLVDPITLCGTMFGLKVMRHRLFESNLFLFAHPHVPHRGRVGFGADDYVTPAGHGGNGSGRADRWARAMDIDWMSKNELTQAIPPAYSEFLGRQVIEQLQRSVA